MAGEGGAECRSWGSTGAGRAISAAAAAPTAPVAGPAGAGPEGVGSQWEDQHGEVWLTGAVGNEMKTVIAESQ